MLYKNGRPWHYADRKTALGNIILAIVLLICAFACVENDAEPAVSIIAFVVSGWQFVQGVYKFIRNSDAGYN